MFESCVIRGVNFTPARFCAPLAGYTHSAFRRLVAEFGGCGAFWTEMLAAKQIIKEDFAQSPWVRKRPHEGRVVFQLMTRIGDPLDLIMNRLAENGVDAVDLNLACDAFHIRAQSSGSALFENFESMKTVVAEARRHWPGLLTAKIRLGSRNTDWQTRFAERVRCLEDSGVDALVIHPRFFEDKFRKRAKHELLSWVASLTRLPLIANGDFRGGDHVRSLEAQLNPACAVMVGRMAVVQPWVFSSWDQPMTIDYAGIWLRMYDYILEDFIPAVALRRVQMFTKYYSANFLFQHQFYTQISNGQNLEDVRRIAEDFFSRSPVIVAQPTLGGVL